MPSLNIPVTASALPEGWRVERTQDRYMTTFAIYKEGGAVWTSGDPKPELTVDLRAGGEMQEPQISWPSTSDRRPALALALAAALTMAHKEAVS